MNLNDKSADIEKRISDYGPTKYRDLVLAMRWTKSLRAQNATAGMTMTEIIDKALIDVLKDDKGRSAVTEEQVLKPARQTEAGAASAENTAAGRE